MTFSSNNTPPIQRYEIRFQGPLPARWLTWFDGFQLVNLETGEVILTGGVRDQSELFGVLEKIHGLNLKLLSVNRIP